MVIAIITGWIAGIFHVFSGPDHLAAVGPLSLDQRSRAWNVGVRWGIGHASGVLLVALALLLVREFLPISVFSSWAERLVGVVLVGIGLWGFRKGMSQRLHVHEHSHDGETHSHVHVHQRQSAHPPVRAEGHLHTHAALIVGVLHGFAGSSHFLGVLPALALPTRAQAIGYIAAFGLGTIAAMALFSTVVNLTATRLSVNPARSYRLMMFTASAAAVVVGCVWMVKDFH